MAHINHSFETTRLLVKEWHSFPNKSFLSQNLAGIVKDILTPSVTESLPPAWQGHYTNDRARGWIRERDSEGVNLLIVEKEYLNPLGFVILVDMADEENSSELRLGYLLKESAWGKGIGSELIKGLVDFYRNQRVSSITGGVAKDNLASKRVLKKNGFVCDPATLGEVEQIYKLQFTTRNGN